jgi:MraZ protein
MLLTGTFVRALDEKLRFAIPKRLRDALSKVDYPAENPVLYLAPGTDGSLALYTESALNTMAAQLSQGSPTSQGVRAFSRLFYAQAQPVEMDRQGRIRVPTDLAELANLGREIVLLGVCDHLEIWDRQRWDDYLTQKQPQYDDIAENAFGSGGAMNPAAATAPTSATGPPHHAGAETNQRPPHPR